MSPLRICPARCTVLGMTTTTTASRLFGRCPEKGCATRIVLDPATDPRVRVETVRGHKARTFQVVKIDAAPRTDLGHNVIVGGGGDMYCATKHGHGTVCGPINEMIQWQGIKATLNTTTCDQRCWNATSVDCKCECGGARHGELA